MGYINTVNNNNMIISLKMGDIDI